MKRIITQILFIIPSLTFGQTNEILQIKEAIKKSQYDKGLEIIKNLIENNKGTNIVYYYKANLEFEKKQFEFSIVSATTAFKTTNISDTLYPRILTIRSLSYCFAGKLDSGIIDNETLVRQFPDNIGYLLNMSYLYSENQQFNKSITVLNKAMMIDSLDVYIINNLAYTYGEAKNYSTAINYAVKGLKLTKDSIWIASLLNTLGFAQAKTISAEKGLQTINQSITYRPNNAFAYYNIGLIYLDQKDIDNACLNFKKAKQLGGINMTSVYLKEYCE